MKGVSAVIATILMLMITIGLAGVAASYFFGWLTVQTATSIEVDPTATDCNSTRDITVYVRNTGTEQLSADNIKISGTQADGTPIAEQDCGPNTLTFDPGSGSKRCPNTVVGSSGTNKLIVSGPTNTARTYVTCRP